MIAAGPPPASCPTYLYPRNSAGIVYMDLTFGGCRMLIPRRRIAFETRRQATVLHDSSYFPDSARVNMRVIAHPVRQGRGSVCRSRGITGQSQSMSKPRLRVNALPVLFFNVDPQCGLHRTGIDRTPLVRRHTHITEDP